MAEMSELCKIGQACLNGDASATYPGDMLFIDPTGMNSWQVLWATITYGYVLFMSANMIGDGAELLLLAPAYKDLVGSVVLPVLGAVPDGMMVLFSGIGPLAVAQDNVAVGVGAIAGSTIMLLTLPWVLSVYGGKVDMKGGECVGYGQKSGQRDTAPFMQTGIEFNMGVRQNAKIMLVTSLTYFIIQFPALMVGDQKSRDQYASDEDFLNAVRAESGTCKQWALIGCIACTLMFFAYLYLQYVAAQHEEKIAAVAEASAAGTASQVTIPYAAMLVAPPAAADVKMERLIDEKGLAVMIKGFRAQYKTAGDVAPYSAMMPKVLPKYFEKPLRNLYSTYAAKSVGKKIHQQDLKALLEDVGLKYTLEQFTVMFKQVDDDQNADLDQEEFMKFFTNIIAGDGKLPWEHEKAADDADADDDDEEIPDEFKDLPPEEQEKAIIKESCKQMLIGTILVLIFSDPMVDVLNQIGKMTGIPAFYVAFTLAPLASNASELVSSYKLACKKTKTSITQSLQTLEGAACMNNTFCLAIFMALIYYQGLAWKFTAETFSIFFSQFLLFLVVMKGNKQPAYYGLIVVSFYPLSLIFVYGLEAYGLD
jgi:Ca2+/Na+ antiporter